MKKKILKILLEKNDATVSPFVKKVFGINENKKKISNAQDVAKAVLIRLLISHFA